MRPIAEMNTVQIELTSACVLKCSNCTRFSGTHATPFFIDEQAFRDAIDSLVGFTQHNRVGIVGFMGGEPMLHPKFGEFCDYALSKIPRESLGLWSTFPDGKKYHDYREKICDTFGNILLNDHTRNDIYHAPVLMAAEDLFDNDEDLFLATERCWIQESWSAAINPKGAWFCEVAASLSDLFDGPDGWKVEPGWWKKTTKDFAAQREWACRKCGAALPLERRLSVDERDDVSKSNLERLKAVKARKVKNDLIVIHEKKSDFKVDPSLFDNHGYPKQTYKDFEYRSKIAAKYNIGLRINSRGYHEPFLLKEGGEGSKSTRLNAAQLLADRVNR